MRLRRAVLWSVAGLAVLGLVLVGGAAWLLGTASGTGWLLARALPRAAPYLTVEGGTSGALLDTLELRDVTLSLPGHTFTTPRIRITLDAGPLLAGTLHVRELDAAAVSYTQVPGAAAGQATPGMAFELPFDVVVERIGIAGIDARAGDIVQQVGPTEAALSWRGRELEITELATSAAGFELAGRAAATLAEPLEIDAALDWRGSYAGRELAGSLSAGGALTALDVRHELSVPFPVVTEGRVALDDGIGFELANRWTDAALSGFDGVRSPAGTLDVAGTLEQFSFEGGGRVVVAAPDGEPRAADVTLTGERDGATLRVAPLALEAEVGRVEAAGSYDLAARTFELDVTGTGLDPASELQDWPADLDAEASVSGRLDPELEVVVERLGVDGELRGRPLTAGGGLRYTPSAGLTVRELSVQSGPSRVTVDGRFGERVAARVDAAVDELARWVPALEGSLNADLALEGSRASPRVSGRVVASRIAYEDIAVERLSFEGDVGTALDARVDAVIEARSVTRGRLEAGSITAELDGTARAHTIALDVGAPEWSVTARAAGGIDERTWRGGVERFDLVQRTLGAWALTERAELVLGPGNRQLGSTCLVQDEARVCGSLTLTGSADDGLNLSATDFDVRALEPLLPPDIEIEGIYQLEARVANLRSSPTGSIAIDGGPTTVGLALSETETAETVIDSVDIDVGLADWAMSVEAGFSGRQTGEAAFALDVADVRAETSPVTGRVSIGWRDLAPLALLTPDVGRVGGSVGVDLTLGGTLDEPTVEGSAELADGSISVPVWGTDFEAIAATATSTDGRSLDIEASARAGDGTLTLEATTMLDPGAGWPTRGLVRGERVRAVQLPDAEVLVSPNLNVLVRGTSIEVAGSVHVPSADVRIEQLPQQAVTPSADAIVHGTPEIAPEAEPRPLDVTADMTLSLGDDVSYEGSGLMADLAGQLRLQYRSGQPETATGTLRLDGQYTAYGQTLNLETGRLLFTGPLDNPRLDVRAVRRIDEATSVGVQLSGPLQSPRTTIFSMPTMSEADALSYLLLGRPIESAGESADSSALRSAALSMGLQQALPVVERIGQTLGLDELTVASTEVDSGALMAGKQLSPKLYMRYSYGLFNRIGGLLLRFRINDRLSIETRSGDQKSMDLLYTVEKD